MDNKELLTKFYSFVLKNQVKDEALIDDYYKENKTEENKKELKKACLYAKANIASESKKHEKSISFYKKIINDNLSRDEEENILIELLMCEEYIKSDKKKEALLLINNYFNQNKRGYDLDYLVCYANVTEDTLIREPYTSILTGILRKLGYKKQYPKSFEEFLELHSLYKKENAQVGQILMLSDRLKQEKSIANFINQTSFSLLAEQFKK